MNGHTRRSHRPPFGFRYGIVIRRQNADSRQRSDTIGFPARLDFIRPGKSGRRKGNGGRGGELPAVHHSWPQLQCSDFAAAALLKTAVPLPPLRGKIARHSRKMLGKKAANALVSQSLASKPGWPTCVLGRSMFNTRLAVNVIAQG